jgi:hypothetical protein
MQLKSGSKLTGVLKSADAKGVVITVKKQVKPEGAKRKITVEEDQLYSFDEIKYSFGKIMIFLHINENDQSGLFLLTRSIDQRYWEYDSWEINLSIGDQLYKNGDRPIWYTLNRKLSDDIKLDNIFSEIKSLCKSLNEISFNKKIIEYYNIDESKISVVDEIMFNRLIKINGLLDNV